MSSIPAVAVPTDPIEMDELPTSLRTRQFQFVCPLCCNDISTPDESVTLTACDHQGCRACMTRWIEKQEASGQAISPTCPFCRLAIHDEEVQALLGRSFKQQEAPAKSCLEEIDELTLQWLNNQTKLCPGCGSRVEKVDGCDHMTCLCGCEFCFECGSIRCICDDEGIDYTTEEEPIRDRNGIVNLRACMQRSNGMDVRGERARRSYEVMTEEENRWAYADSRGDDFQHHSCDGRWLFSCRKNSASVTVLKQQYNFNSLSARQQRYKKRQEKEQRSRRKMIEEESRWMFTYERVRDLHLHDDSAFTYDSCDGEWLFSCMKISASAIALMQQCNSFSIRRQRYEREQLNQLSTPADPSWLIENEGKDSQLRALHLLFCRDSRCDVCHGTEEERDSENLENIRLLFWSGET